MPEGPEREAAIARSETEIEAEKQEVLAAGGLFVLATERHESRRIIARRQENEVPLHHDHRNNQRHIEQGCKTDKPKHTLPPNTGFFPTVFGSLYHITCSANLHILPLSSFRLDTQGILAIF